MIFEILPLSNDNPDSDIISLIEDKGIELFTFYFDSIKEGNENDLYYYSYYLQWMFFDAGKWNDLILSLYGNKNYIGFIDFLESDSLKKEFVNRIVKLYKREDIDQIVLHKKILPYFEIQKTNLFTILLNSNRLQLKPYIKCHQTRNDTVKWIDDYYAKNLRFKSLTLINVIDLYRIEKKFAELINITEQLLEIFNKGATFEKIQNFKVPNENKPSPFLNKLFFMIQDFYELSVINLVNFRKYLDSSIIQLRDELDNEDEEHHDVNFTILKMEFYEDLLDKLEGVKFNKMSYYDFYRYDMIIWLSHIEESHPTIDNILDILLTVLSEETVVFDDDLFNLMLRITKTDDPITQSTAIKIKAALLLANYYEPVATGVKQRILLNLNNFVSGMVSLYNDLTDYDDFNVFLYYQQILHMLRAYKQNIYESLDQPVVEKFIFTLLTNYLSFYKGYINSLYTANRILNGESTNYDTIDPIKPMIEWYQKEIFVMDEYIVMDDFLKRSTCVGNRDKLAMIIGFKVDAFAGNNRSRLKINIANKYFKPLVHMMNIYYILEMLSKSEEFIGALVNETMNLKTVSVIKILNILVNKKQISDFDRGVLLPMLDKINEQRENDSQMMEDIPDDLLDPIMGTLIKNPIILPNTNTLMDYDVIMRHLMEQSNNPFSREELTKAQLDEYNERPDIQERLDLFKQRLLDNRKTCK